ncbi:hypothetical protein [Lelliottia sp. CFBP8978]|uniref:hypothetical protein n=1 Tax=Lelliottia sp. CFBP8978 TaxID=3096522 RepID=UPI002A69E2AF|nr:hypothetical protein [Lelliottia sp. CFBP8978]MDY1037066.1 hypothetical protein [Lelliottia sp. CFBP8978]
MISLPAGNDLVPVGTLSYAGRFGYGKEGKCAVAEPSPTCRHQNMGEDQYPK